MKILFGGGGTGGHIAPGIALAEAILRIEPDSDFLFAATGREAEKYFFGGKAFRREVVNAPRSGGSIFSLAALPFRLVLARRRCKPMIREFAPDAAVGLGGYASVPVMLAARGLNVPFVLIEQNAIPGRATRFLATKAREIYCQFACTVEALESRATPILTGTPVRPEILSTDRGAACATLKLDPARRTIFITGGSQGASGLNSLILAVLPRLKHDYGLLQIVHQTGEADYERVKSEYAKYHIESRVFRFVNPVAPAFHAADVVVCRAGATGIAEVTALGLPSILVPYPHSLDDEQRANAMQLVERGAAFLVEEKSERAPDELFAALSGLLDDRDKARKTAESAARMGFPRAAETIAERIAAVAQRAAEAALA